MSLAHDPIFARRRRSERSRSFLAALHRQPLLQEEPAHDRRAKDMLHHPDGRKVVDGIAGCGAATPATTASRSSRPSRSRRPARLRAGLPVRPSQGVPARHRASPRWRRATSTMCSSPTRARRRWTPRSRSRWPINVPRRGLPHPPHRPRARLSRRRLRRHLGGWHRQQPQVLRRAAGRRGPPAAHLQPARAGVLQGRAGMGRAPRRRAGAHRDAARRVHHRRRHRRADGGIDRRAAAAQGLPEAAAGDLRQARHPADLRRGNLRLRPPGHAFAAERYGVVPGHDHASPRP